MRKGERNRIPNLSPSGKSHFPFWHLRGRLCLHPPLTLSGRRSGRLHHVTTCSPPKEAPEEAGRAWEEFHCPSLRADQGRHLPRAQKLHVPLPSMLRTQLSPGNTPHARLSLPPQEVVVCKMRPPSAALLPTRAHRHPC